MAAKPGRNSAGESTVYQDTAGRWHAYVSMGLKDNGRRDRRHVSGMSRRVVVERKKALETKRDAQTIGSAGKLTVDGWLTYWLEKIAAQKVRPSTLNRYEQIVRCQLVPKLGHHQLVRLQPEHVETAYSELLKDLAPATVLQAHRVLSRALKVAAQRDRVARNVCTLVDAPSVPDGEVEPLEQDEARRVLRAAGEGRNAARWSTALALGMRQGECLGLPLDDLDVDAGTLRVSQALQRQKWRHGCADPEKCGKPAKCPKRRDGGLLLVQPKSRAGKRTIALPPPLVAEFRSHLEQRAAEKQLAGSLWVEHGLVFCQPNGKPLDPRSDHRAWRALLTSAGVEETKLHNARHTAATVMLAMGIPSRVVMQILGHSQITLTLGTYQHVMREMSEDAAKRVGGALWG